MIKSNNNVNKIINVLQEGKIYIIDTILIIKF